MLAERDALIGHGWCGHSPTRRQRWSGQATPIAGTPAGRALRIQQLQTAVPDNEATLDTYITNRHRRPLVEIPGLHRPDFKRHRHHDRQRRVADHART